MTVDDTSTYEHLAYQIAEYWDVDNDFNQQFLYFLFCFLNLILNWNVSWSNVICKSE